MPAGAPRALRCEYQVDPIGLGVRQPRLFWKLDDPRPGACQSAYRVLVASDPERLARALQCVHLPEARVRWVYQDFPLQSREASAELARLVDVEAFRNAFALDRRPGRSGTRRGGRPGPRVRTTRGRRSPRPRSLRRPHSGRPSTRWSLRRPSRQ